MFIACTLFSQTSAASSVLLYTLAKNPAEQEKLREEVLRVIPDPDVGLNVNDLDQMPYMRACVKESMRVQPIITAHLRSTGQHLIVEGYQIPKDVMFILLSIMRFTCSQLSHIDIPFRRPL